MNHLNRDAVHSAYHFLRPVCCRTDVVFGDRQPRIRRERRAQLAPYVITDIYFNAPSGPYSGISARTVQFEGGLMFAATPMWEVHGFTLPRIGVGYRVAGVLSGWRLVLGDPF